MYEESDLESGISERVAEIIIAVRETPWLQEIVGLLAKAAQRIARRGKSWPASKNAKDRKTLVDAAKQLSEMFSDDDYEQHVVFQLIRHAMAMSAAAEVEKAAAALGRSGFYPLAPPGVEEWN